MLGTVKVWDIRQQEKPVLTIKSKETKDIWAVAYGKIKKKIRMMNLRIID
jgi:hypothetical protein